MTEFEFTEQIAVKIKKFWPALANPEDLKLWYYYLQRWHVDDVVMAINRWRVDHGVTKPSIKVILAIIYDRGCKQINENIYRNERRDLRAIAEAYREKFPEQTANMDNHEIIKMHDRTSRLIRFAKLIGMRGKEGKFITEGEILEDFGKNEQEIRGWWGGLTENIQDKLREVIGG